MKLDDLEEGDIFYFANDPEKGHCTFVTLMKDAARERGIIKMDIRAVYVDKTGKRVIKKISGTEAVMRIKKKKPQAQKTN